jgi:outer membrane biosynthesis protein TonB
MSDEDKVRMKQALAKVTNAAGVSIAGFFRSNTRRELVLDEEDQAVAKEFFSDPNNVFLLVRPFAMKPSAGAFFFWEGGQLPEASYQQFPFKRAELVKSFSQFIVAAPEAPVVREPLMMPKREERPAPPPPVMKREEPKPAFVAPPRREDPPPPPAPPVMRREEPKREEAPPPPVFKREEPKASPAPPVSYRREERQAPVIRQREERPPMVPAAPQKRDERPSGPTLVSRREEQQAPPKREERPPAPVVTPRREERPPVVAKREERPVAPPIVSRREEPAPPKPEEKPVIARPAETVVVAPAPKREEPPKVEQVKVEPPKAEPVKPEPVKVAPPKAAPVVAATPRVQAVAAAPIERAPSIAADASEPGMFSRLKWVIVAVLVVLALGGGYFFYSRSNGPAAPAKVADTLLGLKVETNAGQLLLSWNRNATMVAAATRATLTINDGDHKEDVDLDLATLHNGSIVYSPISNDVSFRLEVADQKTGKSEAGSVRRLAGRPSAAVAATNAPQQAQPQVAKQTPATNERQPTQPAQAAPVQQQPAAPQVSAGPAVTKEPVRENSLASRLRAAEPAEMPAAPAMDSQSNSFGSAANVPGSVVAPPPPVSAAAQRQTQPAASQTRAGQPAPAAAQPAGGTRIGGQAQEAKVLKRFPATYPLIAKTSHIVGIVRVHAVIGKNGRVKKATALSGPQILRSAAIDSVLKWVYSPAILDGEPVEAETQVDVNFQM